MITNFSSLTRISKCLRLLNRKGSLPTDASNNPIGQTPRAWLRRAPLPAIQHSIVHDHPCVCVNNLFIVLMNTNLVLYFLLVSMSVKILFLLIRESICIELYYWSSDVSQRQNETEILQLGNLTPNEKQESLTYSASLPVFFPKYTMIYLPFDGWD